jgi:Tol biopolymer transport system component
VQQPDLILWRSRVDGSARMQLSYAPAQASLPKWSPDGQQIAYIARLPGRPWKIFVVPAQGGPAQELLAENDNQMDVNWSADGSTIIFGRAPSLPNAQAPNPLSIKIYNLKTGALTTLPGSEGLFSPRWSPDGRYLAALDPRDNRLMLYDFQSQKWTVWLSEPGSPSYPVWSRDSQELYFERIFGEQPSYRRLHLGQRQSELVADLGSLNRLLGQWGTWSGMTPDRSPLFVRDLSTNEVYALEVKFP